MSMLAEPRRKNRYCLTPKGKPLFEDSDRFGTKMLEKMGWSKGKGLGKEEDGIQEFIRVKIKPDAIGLGFDIRDDQWTEHEKHFNGLLDNLNGDEASNKNSTLDDGETVAPTVGLGFSSKSSKNKKLKDKFSGQSLEEKSKNSRARVHYKKFTKGKDISQYSEKDLANIFGKKPAPEDTNIYNQFQAFNAVENDSDEKEDIQTERKETGTINTGVSINDYFKMKMSAMQEKLGSTSSNPFNNNIRIINNVKMVVPGSTNNSEEQATEEEAPRKMKKSKKQLNEVDESVLGKSATDNTHEEKEIRKTKELKDRNEERSDSIEEQESNFNGKIKKKNKHLPESHTEESTPSDDTRDSENQQKKKKKKSKKHEADENDENLVIPCVPLEDEVSKKKKKSKKRSADLEEDVIEESVPIKKKKSKKSIENQSEETFSEENSVSVQIETFSESTNQDSVTNSTIANKEEEIKTKQSKKKKKKNKTKTPTPSNEEVSSPHKDLNSLTDVNNYLLDTFTISTFCAEKFRNVDADKFEGSNLMNLNGYGLSENLQLKIKNIAHDAERIMRLWSGTLNKYTHSTAEKKMYSSYVKKAKNARKANKNIPKLRAKNLKRKNVFQCV